MGDYNLPIVCKILISDETCIAAGSFAHRFAILCENGEEYLKFTFPQEIEARSSVSKCKSFLFIGCANGIMYAINLLRKEIAWEYPTQGKIRSAVSVCGDFVIFGSYDGFVYCLNVKDGALRWKTELLASIKADIIYYEKLNMLYVGTIKGMCYALKEENGDVIWVYKVDGPIFGSPCIVGDCTVWPIVTGKLYCTSSDGKLIWTLAVDGHIFSSLIVKGNVIYFGCHDSHLYKIITSSTEHQISKILKLESETSSSPFLYHYQDKLFLTAVCNVGILYVIDDSSNSVVFKMKLPAECFSSPFVFANKLYVGCRDDRLYCVNIEKFLTNTS